MKNKLNDDTLESINRVLKIAREEADQAAETLRGEEKSIYTYNVGRHDGIDAAMRIVEQLRGIK